MKHNKFEIHFSTGKTQVVYAFNGEEAVIIAQAREIENGHSYEVTNVYIEDKGRWLEIT